MRVGHHEAIVHPGQVAHIKYKVPADFTSLVALFEVSHLDIKLEQRDFGDGLVEVHHTKRPYVEIPVGNHTQHNVTLGHFTVLGSIQPINKIVETDQAVSIKANEVDSPAPDSRGHKSSHPSWSNPLLTLAI